jgi:YggT family protein
MSAILHILIIFLEIYFYIIVARVIISWIRVDPYHPVVQFLIRVTDPVLEPIKSILPPIGGFDLSPIVAILIIRVLVYALSRIG